MLGRRILAMHQLHTHSGWVCTDIVQAQFNPWFLFFNLLIIIIKIMALILLTTNYLIKELI
ncbi:hypothetical protein NTGHW29_420041 [Candidatus Nitrotoga sp. HW29]|nr:hypothetical protein NTGHW29_420041 [Candidatus Nitrotoga sp. HW29]